MTTTIRKVDYFKLETAHQPGAAASALGALRDAGVNLLVFTGFPTGRRAQMDFIPEDPAAFKAAVRKIRLHVTPKKGGFLVQGDDRVGAIADVMEVLALAQINVTAIDAVSAGGGRFGAVLWVKPADGRKAAKALGIA